MSPGSSSQGGAQSWKTPPGHDWLRSPGVAMPQCYGGKIRWSRISPQNLAPEGAAKCHPRCVRQPRQIPTRQAKPGNQVNSSDKGPTGMHPSAALKQPMVNTMPAGLAKVCCRDPAHSSCASSRVMGKRHSRHRMRCSSSVSAWTSFSGAASIPFSGAVGVFSHTILANGDGE